MSDSTKKNEEKKETKIEKKDEQMVLEEEELSEEDQKIKADLELLVERVGDKDIQVVSAALAALKKEIRASTGTMTSVPKPLKFLKSHYEELKSLFEKLHGKEKAELADIISWLGMTLGARTRECLRFKLMGTKEAASAWGHEYVRHLCLEIGAEYNDETDPDSMVIEGQAPIIEALDPQKIEELTDELVPFLASHNGEHEACDLLLEIERLDKILPHINELNYKRICLYLISCASYLPEPDDLSTLRVVMQIYNKMGRAGEELRMALSLADDAAIRNIFSEATGALKLQMALLLGEHGYYELLGDEIDDKLIELMGNVSRPNWFQKILAKDLDILEPKLPEEIYKDEITGNKTKNAPIKTDSAKNNLSSTFVNGFLNAGFSKDKLMTEGSNGDWLFKNREHGRISAAASVGLICLWDPDTGANELDRYSYTTDDYVKAGVMLGMGITNVNIRTSFNIAYTFLMDHINSSSPLVMQCAALGMGFAYAGSPKPEVKECLSSLYDDVVGSSTPNMELQAHVVLAMALNNIGSCDSELSESWIMSLIEKGQDGMKSPYTRFFALALGLLYLGKGDRSSLALEALQAVPGHWGEYIRMTVETCAYAGSGNVLKIQSLLGVAGQKLEDEKSIPQAVAVLGLALIASREEIGRQMVIRSFDHLMQYGEAAVRRAVPLAMGLLMIGDPDISIMDTLSKFSHDHDSEVAMGAIFALGLIGAGTNNSRIAGLLRNLSSYYAKESNPLFIVRLAQGLVHLGKGTITLNPFHSDRFLHRPAALAGILITLHACLDFKQLILGKSHYLLYALSLAMQPRMLITLDENLEHLPVSVRVGTAVDVVGKAGNPKSITGFQTHNTPVLVGTSDRAELATDEYIAVAPILEGVVILQPNPDSKKKKF